MGSMVSTVHFSTIHSRFVQFHPWIYHRTGASSETVIASSLSIVRFTNHATYPFNSSGSSRTIRQHRSTLITVPLNSDSPQTAQLAAFPCPALEHFSPHSTAHHAPQHPNLSSHRGQHASRARRPCRRSAVPSGCASPGIESSFA
jgi:hypothetical protein